MVDNLSHAQACEAMFKTLKIGDMLNDPVLNPLIWPNVNQHGIVRGKSSDPDLRSHLFEANILAERLYGFFHNVLKKRGRRRAS
jgi:hypothetical protein